MACVNEDLRFLAAEGCKMKGKVSLRGEIPGTEFEGLGVTPGCDGGFREKYTGIQRGLEQAHAPGFHLPLL